MSYEDLARKYRPQNFDDVVGQESVTRTISNSLKLGRIAPAYLFFGPRGCGKTSMARILAKALNCQNGPTAEPCNKCVPCMEITRSNALDVLELDAASHTQVEKVRQAIIETVALVPARDRYKIFILDEVHMLSSSSFNALLKTIEEPPPRVVFVLATTEQTKIPLTITSRCQGFRFKPLSKELIFQRLKDVAEREKFHADSEALEIIASSASGSMRDALTLLDRAVSFSPQDGKIDMTVVSDLLGHVREDLLKDTARALLSQNGPLLHECFEKIRLEGYDVLSALKDLRNLFAGIFLHGSGFSRSGGELRQELRGGCPGGREDQPPGVFARLARRVNRVVNETKNSDSPAVVAELGLFSIIEASNDIEDLVRRLESLESRLSAAGGPSPEAEGGEAERGSPPARDIGKPQSATWLTDINGGDSEPKASARGGVSPHGEHRAEQSDHSPRGISPELKARDATKAEGAEVTRTDVQNPGSKAYSPEPRIQDNVLPSGSAPQRVEEEAGPHAESRDSPASGSLWRSLLERVDKKNPILYGILASCRVFFEDKDRWKLLFTSSFHLETVERSKKKIKSTIKDLSGQDVSLILELDSNRDVSRRPHKEEISDKTQVSENGVEETDALPQGDAEWQDIPADDSIESDPGVKKVLKVFHGRIRKK